MIRAAVYVTLRRVFSCRSIYVYIYFSSVAKRLHGFLLDPELAAGLKRVKHRDGIAEGEQVRRALAHWLKSKGLAIPKGGRRKGTAKK